MFPGMYSMSLFLNYFIYSSLYFLITTPVLLLPSSSWEPLVLYICESVLTNIFEHLPCVRHSDGLQRWSREENNQVPTLQELMILCNKKALFKWDPCRKTREEWRFLLGTESLSLGNVSWSSFLSPVPLYSHLPRLPVVPFVCVSQILTFVSNLLTLITLCLKKLFILYWAIAD